MNTATTTLTLHEGYFARRNWFDWLFAALAVVGACMRCSAMVLTWMGMKRASCSAPFPVPFG